MSFTSEKAQEFGRRYVEAWCSHDPEKVASFYSQNGQITVNGGEPCEGRGAIAEMAQGFFDAFPDLVVNMDMIRTSGTHSVLMWTLEGTNSGPDGTGNKVKISGWEYWEMSEEGLVLKSSGHFDALDYERQLSNE